MGIPRFYRWLSERYPLINENITAEQIPEFDNLYLDMNGIIHNCSHANTGGLCVKDEGEVFVEAFKYITRLFYTIRPKKLLYMAVDGCAPRAKMNQQRSRRFRAANEAREAREQAEEMGDALAGPQFDSNCITPGTDFMAKLTAHLRFFVCMKIQEDPLWQDVTVVLSGPDEPGEGEHKIMDYIRTSKAQPGYNANTRHCLYGLDADLIMLALVSHEPHFALLREEVLFGRRTTQEADRRLTTAKDRFQLLHVSLLREYLELEFRPAPDVVQAYPFSLERVIDDFVLFCILVGNDFLPCLPFAEIGENGLSDFFEVYKEQLKRGSKRDPPWLTKNCGDISFPQLSGFLQRYARFEEKKFEGTVDDGNFAMGLRRTIGPKDAPEPTSKLEARPGMVSCVEEARVQYYEVKFGMDIQEHRGTQEQRGLFQSYLEGLQWVLWYYFRGPQQASWSWYYPYYHAPLIADLANYDRLSNPTLDFEIGAPFQPFQQLMAVLPSNSKKLLPECYQPLFDAPSSPILDFYPRKFEIDMDGVKVPWGGVTLIPFINEARLKGAMRAAEGAGAALSPKHQAQNQFGRAYSYRYDRSTRERVSTPMPHKFRDLEQCPVRRAVFEHPSLPAGRPHFPNDLLPGFNQRIPGFPTLHIHALDHTFESGIRVFQQESRSQSLYVRLFPAGPLVPPVGDLQRLLAAPSAIVDFPFARRGVVTAVHTADRKFLRDGQTERNSTREHEDVVHELTQECWRKGLTVEAATGPGQDWQYPVAEVQVAEATYLDGHGDLQLRLKPEREFRLLHLVRDPEQERRGPPRARSVAERFPVGSAVLCVDAASELYGEVGGVVGVDGDVPAARFDAGVAGEAQAELQQELYRIVQEQHAALKWHTLAQVARATNIQEHVVSQVFGNLMARSADKVREDIGMNLMCESKVDGAPLCLPCYSMMRKGVWMFSDLAVKALRAYHAEYPTLFAELANRRIGNPRYVKDFELRLAFPNSPDMSYTCAKLVKYCMSCPWKKVFLAPGSYMALEPEGIKKIQAAVDGCNSRARRATGAAAPRQVAGEASLFRPEHAGSRPPQELFGSPSGIRVGMRGLYAKAYGAAPVGAKCTVTAIFGTGSAMELELLLDEDNFGATNRQGRTAPMRGLQVAAGDFLPLVPPASAGRPPQQAQAVPSLCTEAQIQAATKPARARAPIKVNMKQWLPATAMAKILPPGGLVDRPAAPAAAAGAAAEEEGSQGGASDVEAMLAQLLRDATLSAQDGDQQPAGQPRPKPAARHSSAAQGPRAAAEPDRGGRAAQRIGAESQGAVANGAASVADGHVPTSSSSSAKAKKNKITQQAPQPEQTRSGGIEQQQRPQPEQPQQVLGGPRQKRHGQSFYDPGASSTASAGRGNASSAKTGAAAAARGTGAAEAARHRTRVSTDIDSTDWSKAFDDLLALGPNLRR